MAEFQPSLTRNEETWTPFYSWPLPSQRSLGSWHGSRHGAPPPPVVAAQVHRMVSMKSPRNESTQKHCKQSKQNVSRSSRYLSFIDFWSSSMPLLSKINSDFNVITYESALLARKLRDGACCLALTCVDTQARGGGHIKLCPQGERSGEERSEFVLLEGAGSPGQGWLEA